MAQQVKVLIVGGGAAGLGVAHYLAKQRFEGKVVVLEAKNRIGGRIHTVNFGFPADRFIELGANWIHGGIPANPLYTVASEAGLLPLDGVPIIRDPRVGYWYKSDGRVISKEIGFQVYDIFTKVDAEASAIGTKAAVEETLMEFMKRRFEEELLNFNEMDRKDARLVFESMFIYLSFHVGDTIDKVSLTEYGAYEELPGGDVKLPRGGYLAVLQSLQVPDGNLKLNSEVCGIHWNRNNGKPVKVVCKDGTEYLAEYVVVTTSLGFLKNRHQELFFPPLPEVKKLAIERLGFGRVDKIFLEYEKPFWAAGFQTIRMAWSAEETPKSIFGNDSLEWLRCIFNFDPVLENPNVLMAWLAGDGAVHMETLSEETIADHCTRLLRRFTGNLLIPEPKRVIRSKWCNDEFIRGSYSYVPVHCTRSEISALSETLKRNDGRAEIFFAGEATHQRYFSTVHGALMSGIGAAKDVIEAEKQT